MTDSHVTTIGQTGGITAAVVPAQLVHPSHFEKAQRTAMDLPSFRDDASALAVFRDYAVHRLGGVMVLYHKHALLGLVEQLPADVRAKESVRRVLEDADAVAKAWNGLSA